MTAGIRNMGSSRFIVPTYSQRQQASLSTDLAVAVLSIDDASWKHWLYVTEYRTHRRFTIKQRSHVFARLRDRWQSSQSHETGVAPPRFRSLAAVMCTLFRENAA